MKSIIEYINEQEEFSTSKKIDAPYYVVAIDKSMSGWGRAEGKNSKVVVACHTYYQLYYCEKALQAAREMKSVNTYNSKLPRFTSRDTVSYYDFEDSAAWNKDYMHYYKSGAIDKEYKMKK